MAALPYMPLYVADYLADAAHLTTIQHGAYLMMLMTYWQRGKPLPADDVQLARIARMGRKEWNANRAELRSFFYEEENLLKHRRVDAELAKVAAKSLKCKKAGLASVQQRLNGRSTDAQQTPNHTDTDTSREEKEEEEGNPPSGGQPYVFEGRIIRLQRREYDAWKKAYPGVDLSASLQSRDDWLATEADDKTRKRWFISTSNYLANIQQKAAAVERAPIWDGMP